MEKEYSEFDSYVLYALDNNIQFDYRDYDQDGDYLGKSDSIYKLCNIHYITTKLLRSKKKSLSELDVDLESRYILEIPHIKNLES